MRHHIMSFSGGFDSTLMLLEFLEEMKKFPDKFPDDKIILVSVSHSSIGRFKNMKEYSAREKIFNICKKKYPDIDIDHIKISITLNTTSTLKGNTGLAQPLIWISSIMPFMHEDDILYFGHIKDDAEVLVQDGINKIVSGFTNLQYPYTSNNKHKIKIKYPLMYVSKTDVLFRLYKLNKEIFELCVTCESFDSVSTFCGECHTCVNLKHALLYLMMENDKEKSDFASKYFEKWFKLTDNQKNILNYIKDDKD